MKNKATISADIVSSTALNVEDRLILEKKLLEILRDLKQFFGEKNFYGRLIKGDYIECVLENPKQALRAALILKSFVKSLDIAQNDKGQAINKFKEYGIRIAVGIGELAIFDTKKGIIDGEAIYFSGRAINEMPKNSKYTLIFKSKNEKRDEEFTAIFKLLDFMFNKYKGAQSKVVFYKLLNKTDKEIALLLNKSASTVNQHSTSTGWYAVNSAVQYFEKTIK
ncbi:MAG: RNA polymerase subunit sigma-70 [Dysgonamonadaceae bacterium]|jgi:hypothetical protein|nr:RNA polymerase subunit sigma-70 [Dysgonamonadaceae bacterium]